MGLLWISTPRLEVIFSLCLTIMVKNSDAQTPGVYCAHEEPLGLENGDIKNSQITASSALSNQYVSSKARLNSRVSAWFASGNDKKPWIQVDLGRRRVVTALATQGYASYIERFYLEYGDDPSRLNIYIDNGATKRFVGNSDGNSVKNNTINPPIVARYVKLHAQAWYQHCVLRMELYGCNYTSPTLPPTVLTTTSGPVKCKILLVPQGGNVACSKQYLIGSVCNFTCQSGYTLQGSGQLTCRSDGTWDGYEPACYKRPGKVEGLHMYAVLSKKISVSWKKPADGSSVVKDYRVQWREEGSAIPRAKISTATSADLQVRPYRRYDVMIQAQNSYGGGPWSDILTIRSAEDVPSMTPPNFEVTTTKSLELTVSWRRIPIEGRNGIIKGYNVYFYKSGLPGSVMTKPLGPDTLSCTLPNLEYAAYYISVAGETRIGVGPKTDWLRKTPMEGAPTPPRNLRASVKSSTRVLLNWQEPQKLNGILRKYKVYYGDRKDYMTHIRSVSGQTNATVITGLEEYTEYFFIVKAETAVTGQPSHIVSAKTLEDAPDAVPAIVSAVARDAYTIYVSWIKLPPINRNGIILGYTVFYKVSGQAKPKNVTFKDEAKLSTELANLSPYTDYCIKLAAFTRVGLTKNWDSKNCKWVRTLETGPSAPVDVKGRAKSSIEIYLEWKIPNNPNGIITSYFVYYGTIKDNLDTKVTVTSQTHSTVITGLRKFTTYYFQVRGKTSKPGNASRVVAVTTEEDLPSAPRALSCEEASADSNVLSWNQPSEINGILRSYIITTYELKTGKRVDDPINQTAFLHDDPDMSIMAFVLKLKPYRYYVHTVQAYTIGLGPMANCTLRTKEGVPSAPQDVEATLIDMSITISWKDPSEHNGILNAFTIFCQGSRSYQQTFKDPQLFAVDAKTFSYKVTRLQPGTKYTIFVVANTQVGEGKKSEKVYVDTPSKPPPAPEEPSFSKQVTSSTVVVYLHASSTTNGEVIAHQVIVGKTQTVAKRSTSTLPANIGGYKDNPGKGPYYYIAAEFFGVRLPKRFVLGDGQKYGGYYNAPLEPNTKYDVIVRGVTKDSDGKWMYGEPSKAALPTTAPAQKAQASDSHIGIIAGILGAFLLIAIIIIAVFLYRRSKRPPKANMDCENQRSRSRGFLELRRLAGKKRSSFGEVGSDPEHPAIPVDHFPKHVHKLHKSDDRGFLIEYNKLDGGREYSCDVAYSQDNKAKNRYGNIVAYDHSRVLLLPLENDPSSGYINASHIDGYNKPNGYIATQGPIPPTFNDFWRMVWEQQSSTIVMLTNLQERHKLKCHKYWPDETEDYGEITVRLLRSEHYADYSIRTFNVKRDADKEEREVKQFHFTVWPDHGVPEYPTALLAFRRRVRAYNPPDAGPVIVHCSAGVGRSGTFIVIDAMLDRVNAESTLDIFNYVAYLRSRRTAMVQTEEQYTFCHDAILETLQCGNTQIQAHDLRIALSKMDILDKDTKMTRFESEFKTLNKASPVLPKACYIVASYPECKEKNRYPDILASDFCRVVLTAIDDNEITTYINAVHISGYKQQHAFIVTQYPLTPTITDYWRMLCEQDSACIVVFQPSEEGDFPQFWPEVGTETYDDMITVTCSDEKSASIDNLKSCYDQSEIIELRFRVRDLRTPEKELKIKMFMVNGWTNEEEPPPTSAMITLTAKVERWQQQSGNGPITVVCSDGIGRSGTFCALYSVLERVKIEQVVDVFQAIKAMRIPRPGLVKTNAEYKFIHFAVQEYLTAFDDYANFK